MYMIIESVKADKILIAIPENSVASQLQGIIDLFEKNAIFIEDGYSEQKIVHPKITMVLGDTFHYERENELFVTVCSKSGIPDGFVPATPEVLTSNKKELAKRKSRIWSLEAELSVSKQKIKDLEERIEALENGE